MVRGVLSLAPVLVSYVVRLVDDQLAAGRFVGEVEAVATGQRQEIRGIDDLLSFCQRTGLPTGMAVTRHQEGRQVRQPNPREGESYS